MAKTASKTSKTSGKRSAPPPFITADDLPANRRTQFTVGPSISVFHNDNGTQLFVLVIDGDGQEFTLGVRCKGPDRIALANVCGRNIIGWPGKKIELYVSEGSQGGRFVNVYDPKRASR